MAPEQHHHAGDVANNQVSVIRSSTTSRPALGKASQWRRFSTHRSRYYRRLPVECACHHRQDHRIVRQQLKDKRFRVSVAVGVTSHFKTVQLLILYAIHAMLSAILVACVIVRRSLVNFRPRGTGTSKVQDVPTQKGWKVTTTISST